MELKNKYKKCVNFDLDTKELLKHFKNTKKPYTLIKEFFEKQGFEHRQYSGYISKEPMSNNKIFKIMIKLGQEFIWIKNCIQKIDTSNAPIQMDMKEVVVKSANLKIKQLLQEFIQKLKYYENKKKILHSNIKIKYEKELLNLYNKLEKNQIVFDKQYLKIIQELIKTKESKIIS